MSHHPFLTRLTRLVSRGGAAHTVAIVRMAALEGPTLQTARAQVAAGGSKPAAQSKPGGKKEKQAPAEATGAAAGGEEGGEEGEKKMTKGEMKVMSL